MEGQEPTINATAHHKSSKRTTRNMYDYHFHEGATARFGVGKIVLFCGKEAKTTRRFFGAHSGLTAAYIVLASRPFGQRVPTPHSNNAKRLGAVLTRKAGSEGFGGKRAGGLLEAFRTCSYSPKAV
eukprot:3420326-Pleurochrysis_carterae.AAC.1